MPRRLRVWIWVALLGTTVPGGCESYIRAKAFEQHAPLREASVSTWIPRRLGDEQVLDWLMCRTAVVVGGADFVGLSHDGSRKLRLHPLRAGEPADSSLGSAVAVSDDGYFVTAAHCVSEEPYVLVARDQAGNYVERLGRTVWSGTSDGSSADVAIIHVGDLATMPLQWCDLAEAAAGAEVLSAGVGIGASRFAAGRITGGPIGESEAAPGLALSFRVDSPLIPGDSGGPTIVSSGGLLGICANVEIEVFARPGGGEVLRPDPEFVRRVIAEDRDRRRAGTLSP